MKLILISICFILIFRLCESLDCSNTDSKDVLLKIRKKMICNYDKFVSPPNQNGPVNVVFNTILKQFEFDDATRTMTIQAWLALVWTDNRFSWNVEDYDDYDKTYVPFDLLWVPDITLFESDVKEDLNSCTITDCNVSYNGTVECIMPCEFSIYCNEADYSNWPYDYASCKYSFMSRTKSVRKLNFIGHALQVDSDGSAQQGAWELNTLSGMIINQTNGMANNPEPYSCVMLTFIIKRDSKEFVLQVIIPAVLMILMNIFTLILDADMTERWILYAIYLFSHYIYNEQLQWMLPSKSDSIPNVFKFYCDSYYITIGLMLASLFMKCFAEDEESSPVGLYSHRQINQKLSWTIYNEREHPNF
ncbi:neuronal acetylcholine receptor subunit beta-3-like [Chironomus tepperi]|uniref:neuronal acetylcholine receptor subunit beta-3-like n=1 Tax=Chironomus tepperi TaxID=113505 RepID=UPI00391FBD99